MRELEAGIDPAGFTPRARHRKLITVCLLCTLLAALTALNFAGYGPFRLARLSPSPRQIEHMLRSTLYMAVMDIEAYRRDRGALPRQFADLGIRGSGSWIYEPLGARQYSLTFSDGQRKMTYVSTRSPEFYFAGLSLLNQEGGKEGVKP